jgi:hypothetical protein
MPLKEGIGGEREGDFMDNFSMSIGPLASCDKCFHHQVDHKNGSSTQNRLNPLWSQSGLFRRPYMYLSTKLWFRMFCENNMWEFYIEKFLVMLFIFSFQNWIEV